MAEKIPTALGSVIRSRLSGMTLIRMRAGWANFNQSVNHPDESIRRMPEEWDVLYDNGAETETVGRPGEYTLQMNSLHRASLIDYLSSSARQAAGVVPGSPYDARLVNIQNQLIDARSGE